MPFLSPCSPHITALNERISVCGTPISDAAFDDLVARHGPAIEAAVEREAAAGQALSHFEIVTALAFKHFQEQQVGLGGLKLAALLTDGGPLLGPCAAVAGACYSAVLLLFDLGAPLRALQVDAAVIEVGLGGVRDATNVLQPASLAAAVVTAVGHDHAAALGGSIENIAAAKAGIMQVRRL